MRKKSKVNNGSGIKKPQLMALFMEMKKLSLSEKIKSELAKAVEVNTPKDIHALSDYNEHSEKTLLAMYRNFINTSTQKFKYFQPSKNQNQDLLLDTIKKRSVNRIIEKLIKSIYVQIKVH